MLLGDLLSELNDIYEEFGDNIPVLLHNSESGECQDIAVARFYPRTSYHGAVLEIDEDAVVITTFEWDDEDDTPD